MTCIIRELEINNTTLYELVIVNNGDISYSKLFKTRQQAEAVALAQTNIEQGVEDESR